MSALLPRSVVLVTGLSGAGKASILRALEDLGFEAVDNPPLHLLEQLVAHCERGLAIGVDARTTGFDADAVLAGLAELRANPALRPELVFATAEEAVLLRRFTETRRRHPLAPLGRVVDGIAAEQALTAELRTSADLVIDTSDLPLAVLRQRIEKHFAAEAADAPGSLLTVSLISFAYRAGLPLEADLVLDARFLRNPHYEPALRPRTGEDPEVAAYVEADPDFGRFFGQIVALLALVLPRFVQEGKKYATIAIGCTGGRHRSVHLVEKLAAQLGAQDGGGWRVTVTHRELAKDVPTKDMPPEDVLPKGVTPRIRDAALEPPSPVQA
jgi:RNase adapter protein RapZ